MFKKIAGVVVAVSLPLAAHAALPAEAVSAFDAIEAHVTDILAVMWPIVTLITGGFILIKLFKKGANKAT